MGFKARMNEIGEREPEGLCGLLLFLCQAGPPRHHFAEGTVLGSSTPLLLGTGVSPFLIGAEPRQGVSGLAGWWGERWGKVEGKSPSLCFPEGSWALFFLSFTQKSLVALSLRERGYGERKKERK